MSRSTKKGPYIDAKLFRKIETLNRRGAKEVIRTWSRDSSIFPEMVGHTLAVHDGRQGRWQLLADERQGHIGHLERHRLVEHREVQLEAQRGDVARLLVAEQVAGAADLEVAHRDLEAGAELGVVGERREPLSALSRLVASSVRAAALGYSR